MSTATLPVTEITKQNTNNLRDYATRTDMYKIDPRIIEIEEGHNPRDYSLQDNRAHLDELKASIAVDGVRKPIDIRIEQGTGRIIVVDGECRVRACIELIGEGRDDIKAIPAIVIKAGNEKERLFTALIGNTGKPLSALESGKAFQRLINFGETEESISKRLGYSLRFVKESLQLHDAPEDVKKMIAEQAVTPSLALHELRSKATPEAIESLRQKAKDAKANGQKTARKTQENRIPDPKKMLELIGKLVQSVEDELFEDGEGDDFKYVSVDKATMRKLARLVGITKEEKA